MAFHNTNWAAVNLPPGTYTESDLGDGVSASTIHELFCLADGDVSITAKGGGTFTWTAVAGDKINVVIGNCVVNSGNFVGFKTSHQGRYR